MGRFETTAQTYAARREPYPLDFFTAAAKALNLRGCEAVIDLGTGPGLLALGFAPYVGRIVGVDPEPAMAVEARQAAASAKVELVVIEGRAEDLNADIGRFDVVTIGRALHCMEREATLATFDRILAPGGRVVVLDLVKHRFEEAREMYADEWLGFSEAELEAMLENAGFANVETAVVDKDAEAPQFQTLLALADKAY